MARKEKASQYIKTAVIGLGLICLGVAAVAIPARSFSWGYIAVVAFSLAAAPRMSLRLPRSNFILSFSDAIVFLTFLLYGGAAAVVIAFIETFANCIYLRRQEPDNQFRFILFNSALASLITTFTYVVSTLFLFRPEISPIADTRSLVVLIGLLALTQFFASSIFAAFFEFARSGSSIWIIWRKQCISSAQTQFTGAALGGVIYKVINYSDFMVAVVALLTLGIVYANYRKMISDIDESFRQVEEAERQKAETERERRVEAEHHADQLASSLENEERANAALRKSEKAFQHAALHDSLTGLANRKNFGDILRSLIEGYKRDSRTTFQLLFLDIRSFKNINDSLGHTVGDKVLAIAAKRFVRALKATDTVARIGGDEFAIILRGVDTTGKAQRVARKVYQNLTQPFSLNGNSISIDLNIGIAPCDTEYETPEEILRDADIAMHYAKETKNRLAVFTKELRVRFLERVRLEADLRHAVDRNELSMHYQPIISLTDGRLVGFEALLRWHHSELGMIPPNRFISIAEESGLIQSLTVWILNETGRQLAAWQRISPDYDGLIVSVNISGKHLSNNDLIDDVLETLAATGIAPQTLKLEITESTAMENAEHTINVLNKLKQIGVLLSIDDFGTGYSSLSYLHRLPFDTLKIDRSFVYNVGQNGENSEILQTIISLAKNLKMRVIAEGIETESQLAVLQNLGCDYGQGFLLAKPKPKAETEKLLYQSPNWLPFGTESVYESRKSPADESLPVF